MFTCLRRKTETPQKKYEICSKLPIKTPECHHTHPSGVFIVNFEHISHLYLSVSVVDFEQVNPSFGIYLKC